MTGNQMFCPVCGKPSEAGARFCMSCGAQLPLPATSGGVQTPYATIPVDVVSIGCNICGNILNIAADAQQVRCPVCGSFYQVGRSDSAVFLQPVGMGAQNGYSSQPPIASFSTPQIPDMGKEIEVTRQYLAELEKWNIFKNDSKIVKKWKGKDYARQYNQQQILRRFICLVVMIPGAVVFFREPSANANTIILFISFANFYVCILLMNSFGVRKEIKQQQSYLAQMSQMN